jgi:2-oxoglutarate ferredoxin oxidoreductase subunit alpha
MQENIGYAFITETPIVIVDVQRGSPSTGQPTMAAQGDMMQARWGSHGDYEPIALSPSSVQEFFDFTIKAFNLSEQFRTPVFVMADEIIGHMREKITIEDDIGIVARKMPEDKENVLHFKYVENGTNPMPSFGQGFNIHVSGLTHDERGYPDTNDPESHTNLVQRLCDKVLNNRDKICSVQSKYCEDADLILVSYGAPVRSVYEACEKARAEGKKIGYIKLDTPWPFPEEQVKELAKNASDVLVVELNLGQMYYEVDRVLKRDANVHLMGQIGGLMPTPDEILSKINEMGGN